jgi:hypothetical protein
MYRGGASNPALVQQKQIGLTFAGSFAGGSGSSLAASIDLWLYVDALQLSVGQFTDISATPQVINGLFSVEVYDRACFQVGNLAAITMTTEGMKSLPPAKQIYYGASPGATIPILPWADYMRLSIILRPLQVLSAPLVSAQVSVVGLAYRQ